MSFDLIFLVFIIFSNIYDALFIGFTLFWRIYIDVDFDGDLSNRKSCNDFFISMNCGIIIWGSWKQIDITSPIVEVEYVAYNIVTYEIVWAWCLVMDLILTTWSHAAFQWQSKLHLTYS